MILVSGSIADSSWTLVAASLAVCRHHVLLGSRFGQTHSLTYTHIHTPAPPVPLIPEHVTRQTWDLVILPTSQPGAQQCKLLLRPPIMEPPKSLVAFFFSLHISSIQQTS